MLEASVIVNYCTCVVSFDLQDITGLYINFV